MDKYEQPTIKSVETESIEPNAPVAVVPLAIYVVAVTTGLAAAAAGLAIGAYRYVDVYPRN